LDNKLAEQATPVNGLITSGATARMASDVATAVSGGKGPKRRRSRRRTSKSSNKKRPKRRKTTRRLWNMY